MSLRLRALALVLFVAVTATGATAWLTLREATQQVRDALIANQEQANEIANAVREYGYAHGTWTRVAGLVRDLSRETGQRIRVETGTGAVLVDSDALAGREPRGIIGAPSLVDVRPSLSLPRTGTTDALLQFTVNRLTTYRDGIAVASCLTQNDLPVFARTGEDGVPRYTTTADAPACAAELAGVSTLGPTAASDGDQSAAQGCVSRPVGGLTTCLTNVFRERAAAVAPESVQVFVGAAGETVPAPKFGPTLAATSAVVVAVMLAALLLSRRVLRPVRALMGAAQGLGRGDLAARVPVAGADEIAQLGRAFNTMADSLQSSEESQRRLTADIAHELRTPLANLRGYLEAMRDGVMTPTPPLLESLHEEVLLQQRVVEDLQDLALAESGQLTYHPRAVDLRILLETSATVHSALSDPAGVRVVVEPGGPVEVHADADRLRQVIGNLVGNAIRATSSGGTVSLRAWSSENRAVVEVSDTGTGISPENLPHVFDRFWRADPARGRQTGGSGLGLAIARQIVLDHDGDINVASTLGWGTTFTITLPLS